MFGVGRSTFAPHPDPENAERRTSNIECRIQTLARGQSGLAAEEFLERLKEFVRNLAGFFSEVVQLLGELHLIAAVDFTRGRGNFVRRKIELVGGAGRFATGSGEMI